MTVITYGMFGDPLAPVLFHLDFGEACSHYGCPPVKEIWARSWQADVYLLAGGLVIGVVAGISGAVFCATLPMLQGLAVWAAVLIVVVSALADVVLVMLDPRVRATGRPVG